MAVGIFMFPVSLLAFFSRLLLFIYSGIIVVVSVLVVVFIGDAVFVLLTYAVLPPTPIGSHIRTSLTDRRT
jgi:hypothetical protein